MLVQSTFSQARPQFHFWGKPRFAPVPTLITYRPPSFSWLWWIYLWLLVFIPGLVSAQTLVVLSGDTPLYRGFVEGLESGLSAQLNQETLVIRQERELDASQSLAGYKAIVAVGVNAAKKIRVLNTEKAKVLYALMPRATYRTLIAANEARPWAANEHVLYLDQPMKRYLALIQAIWSGKPGVIGVVYSDESEDVLAQLQEQAKNRFKIKAIKVDAPGDAILVLQAEMRDVNALLTLPDVKLFNSQSIQALLLTSFRLGIPIIAFSDGFVQAGAVAAPISRPEDLGRQAAEVVSCWTTSCSDPVSRELFPKYFAISVNRTVARKMGIEMPDAAQLIEQIKSMERTGGP